MLVAWKRDRSPPTVTPSRDAPARAIYALPCRVVGQLGMVHCTRGVEGVLVGFRFAAREPDASRCSRPDSKPKDAEKLSLGFAAMVSPKCRGPRGVYFTGPGCSMLIM